MKSLKRISKIQTKIKTVLTQMISVGVVALIGLFLIEAPASAFTGSGAGTSADPYQITNCAELQDMKNNLTAHYVLMNDIDCSDTVNCNDGAGFEPVAKFIGSFDGQGHIITSFFIKRPGENCVGLFGILDRGTVKNVGLVDVDITGAGGVGPITGVAHYSPVSNCYSTGNVTGDSYVGGLVSNVFHSTVSNCYSTANVNGNKCVGGLAGELCDGDVINSYSTGSVTGINYIGGLVGVGGCEHNNYIRNCYSTGNVNGKEHVGGLIGRSYRGGITNCHSTGSVTGDSYVGGLVGRNYYATITSSYWDMDTSGSTSSAGGEGKTTAQMLQQSTFMGWDFADIWRIYEGCSYPYLFGQPPIVDTTLPKITCPADVTVEQESYDGTVVPLEATATDICDPNPDITSNELDIYPLGVTVVTFTATDASRNSASCSMSVTVEDTTPPEITCPVDVTVEQESHDGTVVPLEATATDNCDPNPDITSNELDIYPLGKTVVAFTATDASGNSASCSMSVTVVHTTPPVAINMTRAIDELEHVKIGDKKIDKEVDKAIEHINKSLGIGEKHDLWLDESHLDPKHGRKVFDEEKKAVKELMHLIDKKHTPEGVKQVCQDVIDYYLIEADYMLADIARSEAALAGGQDDPHVARELEKCAEEFEKAEEELTRTKKDRTPDPHYDKAIDHYKRAWEHAQKALKKL